MDVDKDFIILTETLQSLTEMHARGLGVYGFRSLEGSLIPESIEISERCPNGKPLLATAQTFFIANGLDILFKDLAVFTYEVYCGVMSDKRDKELKCTLARYTANLSGCRLVKGSSLNDKVVLMFNDHEIGYAKFTEDLNVKHDRLVHLSKVIPTNLTHRVKGLEQDVYMTPAEVDNLVSAHKRAGNDNPIVTF